MTATIDHQSLPETVSTQTTGRQSSHRYIALKWTLTSSYHASWSEAEQALVDQPCSQRAGIVDSLTGKTLASQAAYPAVQAAVGNEVIGNMSRLGPIGDLTSERRNRD